MNQKHTTLALVLSRYLTRFGDHAWDLALPIMILKLYPGSLSGVALYFVATMLGKIIFLPTFSRWLDRSDRLTGVRSTITAQVLGIIGVWCAIRMGSIDDSAGGMTLLALIVCGVVAQLGSSLTHIVVASDWVPKLFDVRSFSSINSWLKQADLMTEVMAPAIAGVLLLFDFGFEWILSLNIGSFLFEFFVLRIIYRSRNVLKREPTTISTANTRSFLSSPLSTFRVIRSQYAVWTITAYALLWFQALTPHGHILTAFLKDGLAVSESTLGMFRSAGALAGIITTLIYPKLLARFSISTVTLSTVLFQMACLTVACISLEAGLTISFLVAIVVSRLGLYGFTLSEIQIRQETVPEGMRTEVAGAASALNAIMALSLNIAAFLFSDFSQFSVLAWASLGATSLAALLTARFAIGTRDPSTHSEKI